MQTYFFGNTRDGRAVTAYRLENSKGAAAVILDYGCIVQSLLVPNARGGLTDVVLGYDSVLEYEENDGYLGAVIGRVANRIAGAQLSLNGETIQLNKNLGEHQLHGGLRGFDRYVWRAEQEGEALVLSRLSPAGEEHYPGSLQVRLRYELTEDCALKISYEAETDADTVANLTNHSYFNLRGTGDILSHRLQLHAEAITENDANSIPTGRILPVAGTPFDFRTPKEIGRDINAEDRQLEIGKGYDQNYVLPEGQGLREISRLFCRDTGILMRTLTTMPGVQLYTSNNLGPRRGKNGAAYGFRSAVCQETQFFPNAMDHAHFPSILVKPGETQRSETVHQFELADEL